MPVVRHQDVNAWTTSLDVTTSAWRGKDTLGKEIVDVSILIGAAILYNDQTVVQIRSRAYRREHHTARGIAEKNQGVASIGA